MKISSEKIHSEKHPKFQFNDLFCSQLVVPTAKTSSKPKDQPVLLEVVKDSYVQKLSGAIGAYSEYQESIE